MNEISPHKTSV